MAKTAAQIESDAIHNAAYSGIRWEDASEGLRDHYRFYARLNAHRREQRDKDDLNRKPPLYAGPSW